MCSPRNPRQATFNLSLTFILIEFLVDSFKIREIYDKFTEGSPYQVHNRRASK